MIHIMETDMKYHTLEYDELIMSNHSQLFEFETPEEKFPTHLQFHIVFNVQPSIENRNTQKCLNRIWD